MNWEIVIGLETHAQLSTVSKMFSGGSTAFEAKPNTQANAVDIALPGVLPVANREAVAKAIRFGLAVNGDDPKNINRRSIFARKNYFYPDLPKGYQISQYELPIVQGGKIAITSPTRGEIEVRLTRAHLEEDAGKSFHGEAISGVADYAVADPAVPDNPLVNEERDLTKLSAIDLNRAGIPLLEIVSEPDMRSAEEAVAYAKRCTRLFGGSTSATATCRRARSAAMRTSRYGGPARRSARAARSRTSTRSGSWSARSSSRRSARSRS